MICIILINSEKVNKQLLMNDAISTSWEFQLVNKITYFVNLLLRRKPEGDLYI